MMGYALLATVCVMEMIDGQHSGRHDDAQLVNAKLIPPPVFYNEIQKTKLAFSSSSFWTGFG